MGTVKMKAILTVSTLLIAWLELTEAVRVGCYKEDRRLRKFRNSPGGYNPDNVEPNGCADACGNFEFSYVGLAQGKYCFCANDYSGLLPNSSGCDTNCTDGSECGGFGYVTVYEVGGTIAKLHVNVSEAIVPIGRPVDFAISIVTTLTINYQFDYGDGAGLTPINHPDMYHKTFGFGSPGEYDVLVKASDANSTRESMANVAVLVEEPVGDVVLLCPEAAVSSNEVECNATIMAGTSMEGTIDFGEGAPELFNIADVAQHVTGPAIPISILTAGTTGMFIMPATEFHHDGILTAFEFYATSLNPLTLLVLKPNCLNYCYHDNQCNGACTDPDMYQCTGAGVGAFCPSGVTCGDSCAAPGRYSAVTPLVTTYEIVANIAATPDRIGYNYVNSAQEVAVSKGYILGYEGGPGLLGTIPADPPELTDFKYSGAVTVFGVGTTYTNSEFVKDDMRHLLRGITVEPQLVRVRHTYVGNGLMHVKLTVTNKHIPGSSVANTTVSIGLGIDHVILNTSECFVTGQVTTVDIMPHIGDDVTYTWDWGDGSPTVSTIVLTNTHSYTSPAFYNVTVTAVNLLATKVNITTVCVQDSIQNLQIFSSTAASGSAAYLWINMTSGSDYTCDWTTDDGMPTQQTTSLLTPSNSNFSHVFTTFGNYVVRVQCYNLVSNESADVMQEVIDPITGLQLTKTGAMKAGSLRIEWTIATGTSPLFTVTFDGDTLSYTYDAATKTGTSEPWNADDTGVFEVVVTGSNAVGNVEIRVGFSIEVDIRDLQFNCTSQTMNVGDTVPFFVTMTQGTGIHLEWNYDDGSVDDIYDKPSGIPWPTSPLPWPWYQRNHVFLNDGMKTVRLLAWNGFSNLTKTCMVAVINPISNISIDTNSPITFVPPGEAEISFSLAEGLPPTNAQVTIDFGDGTDTETYPFQVGVTYGHVYSKDKMYTVTATISNPAGTEVIRTDLVVKEPVVDLSLSASPPHASVGVPVDISVTMFRGCEQGVILHWDFGDGQTDTTLESGSCPNGVSTVSVTYNTVTTTAPYTITVLAENILGNTSASYLIYSQIPVTRDFTLLTESPRLWAPAPSTMTQTFTLLTTAIATPTVATVTWDFGDGTESTASLSSALLTPTAHQYLAPGHHLVTVTIANMASSQQFQTQVGLYEAITNFAVDVLYKPQIPIDSPLSPGFGPSTDTYPTDRDVVFDATMDTGTVVWYKVEATSATHVDICNYTTTPIYHKFDVAESYSVKITAWNSLEFKSITTSVIMMDSNMGLTISDGRIVTATSEKKSFNVTMESVGTDSCLVVNYGDGTSLEAFGDPAICDPPSTNPSARYISTFGATTTLDQHIYWKIGTYTITATATNLLSIAQDSLTFGVSYVPCRSPAVDIKDRAPVFYEPKQFQRSVIFRVIALTDLDCVKTYDNNKRWRVWMVNEKTGIELSEIDVTSLESYKKAELAVPAKFLEYGLYKIRYTVEMDPTQFDGGEIFSGIADTYIEVTKSALIGNMIEGGMSLITYEHGVEIHLSPSKFSLDPDLADGLPQTFDSFMWFCMKKGDRGYPLTEDGSLNITHKTYPLTDPSNIPADDLGGCFREGPGRIGFDEGAISINTVQFDVNKTYEFMVVITKDTRTTTAKVNVTITQDPVPYVFIECKTKDLCERREAGGQKINPSARLALTGRCLAGCSGTVSYKWEGFSYDYKWPYKPIENFHDYTSGTGSPEIAIDKKLFEDFPVASFRIQLSVWVEGGEKGISQIDLHINRPPRGGSCNMSATSGEVLSSALMNIVCTNWVDDPDDYITTYQFYVTFKGEQMERHLVFGDQSDVEVYLPLGPDWDNYLMKVYARIYDTSDSYTTYFIKNVEIHPSSLDLKSWVGELRSGENEIIRLTAATGDLVKSCYQFQSIGSAINMASKVSASEFQGLTVSAQQTPTGYGPGGVDKSHAQSLTTEKEELAKKEKDDRALLRAEMMSGIKDVTTSTVASVALKASTISVIAAYPDELNRQAQEDMMLILRDCADTLQDLSDYTSVEQILAAGANILEGAGKLLVASKYHYQDPLLSDLDSAKEEDYYDTNRETDDAAIESLDPIEGREELTFGTNQGLQSTLASTVVAEVIEGVRLVAEAVRGHLVAGEDAVEIITDQLALSLEKNRAGDLANRTVDNGRGSVTFPDWCSLQPANQCATDQIINLQVITTPSVPYGLSDNAANLSFSNSIDINFVDEDGSPLKIFDSQVDIEVNIPRDPAMVEVVALAAEPVILRRNWEYLFYHRSRMEGNDQSLHLEFRPNTTDNVQYVVFIRFDDFPNITEKKWDFVQTIPSSMAEAGNYGDDSTVDPYTMFLSNTDIPAKWSGKDFFVGLRQLEPSEFDTYTTFNKDSVVSWTPGKDTFTTDYSLRVYTSSCLYYDTARSGWHSDGCRVGQLTSLKKTQCFCNHLTAFAGGLIVAPNAIDWNFVFANADFLKNPTLYVTEIVIFVLYLMAVVWARHKDKKDVEQVGIAPLSDNDTRDKYYYEIVVQTGMRTNAGTDSKVHFIMSGEYEETDVRILSDSKRKIMRRGDTDGFLMAVPRALGPLNYIRIWHDNSGKGKFASWYLKYFLVRDLQTGEKFYFISNHWFAVEEGDGQVDRVIPVAGPEQILQFGHQFSQKTRRNLSDGHLWFSVVARPPRSRFTRVQRVSCCLCLLFLTMLANAMYYGQSPDATGSNSFTIGPFALTPAQLYIGVVTNLIVFPISFLVITLFRKSRPRQKRPSRIQEAIRRNGRVNLSDIRPEVTSSRWSLRSDEQRLMLPDRNNPDMMDAPTPRPGTGVSTVSRSDTSMSGRISYYNADKKKRDKAKRKWTLPWWFQIVAWIVLWLAIGVSVAFVTFYGISFGDYKCKQWITSMLIAFFTSVFVTQPIKVFLTAVILSLIIRNPGEDDEEGDEDEEDPHLGNDEEFLHPPLTSDGYGAARPKKVAYKPPDPQALERARIIRVNEIKMWDVVREITFYGFFLWILMVISYSNRDINSYMYKYSLERNFVGNNISSSDFRHVHNTKNFWNWTTNSLIPSIRASVYYNDDPPIYLRGYINDKVSRIMGYATMRQVRIKKGTCHLEPAFKNVLESCNGEFSFWNEEKGTYGVSWQNLNDTSTATRNEYIYTDASKLDGYPFWGKLAMYSGGGYVLELREKRADLIAKMQQLEAEEWVDKYTRAVFIEFTVYNPQINLFAVSTLLAEWHPSAGVIAMYRFEPVRLLTYMSSAMLFQVICEAAFLLFIFFFIFREVKAVVKQKFKYFLQFWNLMELNIIGLSIAVIVIYFYRLIVTNQLTGIFKESHGNKYMKFQYVGYWNEVLSYLIGWLVFMSTIKFLKLLRFNRRMSLLASTLGNSWKSMFHFGIIFVLVFLSFIQFFYLVYHTAIFNFSSFVSTMEAGFLMMMGKFDIYSMTMLEPVLTPIFFFFFVVTVTFILVNMFISILNESFATVKRDVTKQSNEYEIVDFMLGRFKQWTGIGGEPPPTTKPNELLNNKTTDPYGKPSVDHFPDKVDELLNTISKAYFDQDNLENVLGPKTDADRLAMKNLLKKHAEATKRPMSAGRVNKVANFDPDSGQYRKY